MDRQESEAEAVVMRDGNNQIEAMVSDNINRIAGIQQVGYTGKVKHA